MLSKTHRLLKRSDFVRTAKQGTKFVMHTLVMQAVPSDYPHFRVGFTVTKRCGNAVVRNRIKRRLRAVMFELSKEIELPPMDIVLIGRIGTGDAPYADLQRDVRYGLKKAVKSVSV